MCVITIFREDPEGLLVEIGTMSLKGGIPSLLETKPPVCDNFCRQASQFFYKLTMFQHHHFTSMSKLSDTNCRSVVRSQCAGGVSCFIAA